MMRRNLLQLMNNQNYNIITVNTSFDRAVPGIDNNFSQYADQSGINWFVRLSPDLENNTTEIVLYVNGTLTGGVRCRSGVYAMITSLTASHDFRATSGDQYIKIVQESD